MSTAGRTADAPPHGRSPGVLRSRLAEPGRPGAGPNTRSRGHWPRLRASLLPYLLLLPTVAVLLAVQGYPLVKIITLSLQEFTPRNLFTGEPAAWVGFANYVTILKDGQFWTVTARTVVFTIVNVGLTIGLATLVALLMRRVSPWCRALLTVALVAVWAMPPIVATIIFNWMFDFSYGVANWALSQLPGVDLMRHNLYANPVQGFGLITAIIVWGAVPFVAITLYAGLTQVPPELEEAARVDGASPWQVFRSVTYPVLKPLYVITTTLSVIWDFQVFNQIWVARRGAPEPDYYLLGIYSFAKFRIQEYSASAAIALLAVLMLMVFTIFYIRSSFRYGEFE